MKERSVQVDIWGAKEFEKELAQAARLRIQVFKDFPYLYEGSLDYEKKYLDIYLRSPRSVVVAVRDETLPKGENLVGLSSAIPLSDENDYIQEPFLNANMDVSKIFYFGESILLPSYRGMGLGNVFFQKREESALSFGTYTKTCFCAVDRPADHPLKPDGYKPLHAFWRKRGYTPKPELKSYFSWMDIGESQETKKPMTYWMKDWS